jgi:hypothetical protein
MNFNFGEVLTRAWQIVWKHKVLWIFGILASCGRSSGNFNSNSRGGGNGSGTNLPPQLLQWLQWVEGHMTQFIAITVVILCVIWIIAAFLSTIGKIGLIRGTSQAEGGSEKLIFGQLFSESTPYFWRMFGLSLVLAIPILIVFVALFAGLIIFAISASGGDNNNSAIGFLATVPILIGCVCLLIPVMFVVGMIFRQSERAIVLEELGVLPSISRGWDIFRANLGPIILMAIILAVIGFVVGLAVAIPIIIIVVPAAFAYAIGNAQNSTPLILAGVCFCLYLPILLLANGILTAYTESAWTLTFMRLTRKPESDNNAAPRIEDPVKPEDSDKTMLARPNA